MVLKSAPGAQKETPSESPVRGRLEGVTHRACLLLALRFGVGGGTRGNPATNSYSQNRQALYIRVYRNKDFFISGFYGGGLPVWHMAIRFFSKRSPLGEEGLNTPEQEGYARRVGDAMHQGSPESGLACVRCCVARHGLLRASS